MASAATAAEEGVITVVSFDTTTSSLSGAQRRLANAHPVAPTAFRPESLRLRFEGHCHRWRFEASSPARSRGGRCAEVVSSVDADLRTSHTPRSSDPEGAVTVPPFWGHTPTPPVSIRGGGGGGGGGGRGGDGVGARYRTPAQMEGA